MVGNLEWNIRWEWAPLDGRMAQRAKRLLNRAWCAHALCSEVPLARGYPYIGPFPDGQPYPASVCLLHTVACEVGDERDASVSSSSVPSRRIGIDFLFPPPPGLRYQQPAAHH